jgi:hypothetical protein
MNEFHELAGVRDDVPPMSAQARHRGRARLTAAMAPSVLRQRRVSRRPLAVGLAFGLALTAAVTGAVVIGTPGTQQSAEAAEILNRAAAALEADPDQEPRADQYIYQEVRQLTSAQGPSSHSWSWTAVDGTRPGRSRTVEEIPACAHATFSPGHHSTIVRGDGSVEEVVTPDPAGDDFGSGPCERRALITVYDPKGGLSGAPYTVLAQLPTDPEALLETLRADPRTSLASASTAPGTSPGPSRDDLTWELIRGLAEVLPSAQRAALFRAAATLKGVTVYPDVTDAAGRVGVGVGIDVPHLGRTVIVFDKTSYRYLGEIITQAGNEVVFNRALLRTAVVDQVGQAPS